MVKKYFDCRHNEHRRLQDVGKTPEGLGKSPDGAGKTPDGVGKTLEDNMKKHKPSHPSTAFVMKGPEGCGG